MSSQIKALRKYRLAPRMDNKIQKAYTERTIHSYPWKTGMNNLYLVF
jgi:hypothetical protein